MKKIFPLLLASVLLFSCGETKQETRAALFKLTDVAGKAPAEVESVLGSSTTLEPVKDRRAGCTACPKLGYKDGAVEVVYIDGKADWITVNIKGAVCDERALEYLGLPVKSPTSSNPPDVYRWKNYDGFQEISAFGKGDGEVDYFYVKTKTQ